MCRLGEAESNRTFDVNGCKRIYFMRGEGNQVRDVEMFEQTLVPIFMLERLF